MSVTIDYYVKQTRATTQYVEMSERAHQYLLEQMMKWLLLLASESNTVNVDTMNILRNFWRAPDKTLPVSRTGRNTPESFVAGVLSNMLYGKQRDFSEKQLLGIAYLSTQMALIFDTVTEINLKNLHEE
jgi:hypothetical protein